jgi:uncharacterized protein (DUF1330 family)
MGIVKKRGFDMAAYVIVMVEETTDIEEIKEYRRIGVPTMIAHKPNILLRMAKPETLEGKEVEGVVLLEFPTMEAAKAWYNDPQYQEALSHRFKGAKCHAVIVDQPAA